MTFFENGEPWAVLLPLNVQSDKTGDETAELCNQRVVELGSHVDWVTSDAGPENSAVIERLRQQNHSAFWIKDPCHGLDHVCTEGAEVLRLIGSQIHKFKIAPEEDSIELAELKVGELKEVCRLLQLQSGSRRKELLRRLNSFAKV